MAETKKKTVTVDSTDEEKRDAGWVQITLPFDEDGFPTRAFSVNGRAPYRVPRGIPTYVPPEIYEAYRNATEQEREARLLLKGQQS